MTNPTLPALLDALFREAVNQTLEPNIANLAPTNFPRKDLVAAFLTGFKGVNQLAERDAFGDAAPQHGDRRDCRPRSRAPSALPAAISPASRTAGVRATTSSTSRCAS